MLRKRKFKKSQVSPNSKLQRLKTTSPKAPRSKTLKSKKAIIIKVRSSKTKIAKIAKSPNEIDARDD